MRLLRPDDKIVILNRGESAMRAVRAIREYNAINNTKLKSCVIYMKEDENSPWVAQADDSFFFENDPEYFKRKNPIPYIDHEYIVHLLKKLNAHAIWVGWGFVSEDSTFCKKIEENNITFIGPSAAAMAALGDKITAKNMAIEAKVPTTPWSGGMLLSLDHALKCADEIGYPVILKSALGGGGRGIRKIYTKDELVASFDNVKAEVKKFFGDDSLFMEALVTRARHIEVQAVGDMHGNVLTFGLRDCSAQRNNQKIIEETPPVGMSQKLMESIEKGAADLLKLAKYHGAGTVEYLYDLDRKSPIFMEVNTRLQVEHPITEMLYDIDLVFLQIDVSMGKSLENFKKKKANGHVIEVRLNAEDPYNKFAPSPGDIITFEPPRMRGLRVDSGVVEGSTIPSLFDSMIAKVIVSGVNRHDAIEKLKIALINMNVDIRGGITNKPFLLELLNLKEIVKGGIRIDFVEKLLSGEIKSPKSEEEQNDVLKYKLFSKLLYSVYVFKKRKQVTLKELYVKMFSESEPQGLSEVLSDVEFESDNEKHSIKVIEVNSDFYILKYNNVFFKLAFSGLNNNIYCTVNDKEKFKVNEGELGDEYYCDLFMYHNRIKMGDSGSVKCKSPAVVIGVYKKEGELVKKGEVVLSIEAMKMELKISSDEDGIIKNIYVQKGSQLKAGNVLFDVEKVESGAKSEEVGKKEVKEVVFNKEFDVSEAAKYFVFNTLNNVEIHSFMKDKIGAENFGKFLSENLKKEDLLNFVSMFSGYKMALSSRDFAKDTDFYLGFFTGLRNKFITNLDEAKFSEDFLSILRNNLLQDSYNNKKSYYNITNRDSFDFNRHNISNFVFKLYSFKNNEKQVEEVVYDIISLYMKHNEFSSEVISKLQFLESNGMLKSKNLKKLTK